MAKWIKDWTDAQGPHSILCDEVHASHGQSHNSLSGNPQFHVRLAIGWEDLPSAISRLLGQPSKWIHPTLLKNVVAVDARVINDAAAYGTDVDQQIVNYTHHALVDVTYMPRNGIYLRLISSDPAPPIDPPGIDQPVYLEETEEPRYETLPQDARNFRWGETTAPVNPNPPSHNTPVRSDELPSLPAVGQTLIHTIEGWCGSFELTQYIGTVHNQSYTSKITEKTYATGTLMLRSLSISKAFTFRSYRNVDDPVPTPSFKDFSGRATKILRMVYEYRVNGWEKFYRSNLQGNNQDYYYIVYTTSPFKKYTPFTPADHNIFFSGAAIVL